MAFAGSTQKGDRPGGGQPRFGAPIERTGNPWRNETSMDARRRHQMPEQFKGMPGRVPETRETGYFGGQSASSYDDSWTADWPTKIGNFINETFETRFGTRPDERSNFRQMQDTARTREQLETVASPERALWKAENAVVRGKAGDIAREGANLAMEIGPDEIFKAGKGAATLGGVLISPYAMNRGEFEFGSEIVRGAAAAAKRGMSEQDILRRTGISKTRYSANPEEWAPAIEVSTRDISPNPTPAFDRMYTADELTSMYHDMIRGRRVPELPPGYPRLATGEEKLLFTGPGHQLFPNMPGTAELPVGIADDSQTGPFSIMWNTAANQPYGISVSPGQWLRQSNIGLPMRPADYAHDALIDPLQDPTNYAIGHGLQHIASEQAGWPSFAPNELIQEPGISGMIDMPPTFAAYGGMGSVENARILEGLWRQNMGNLDPYPMAAAGTTIGELRGASAGMSMPWTTEMQRVASPQQRLEHVFGPDVQEVNQLAGEELAASIRRWMAMPEAAQLMHRRNFVKHTSDRATRPRYKGGL